MPNDLSKKPKFTDYSVIHEEYLRKHPEVRELLERRNQNDIAESNGNPQVRKPNAISAENIPRSPQPK